jgi:lysozyme
MDKEKLREQLITDEGYRNDVYLDSFGNLTVGIGHLVMPSDELKEGDTITDEKVKDLFEHDIIHAQIGCRALIQGFDYLPDDLQNELINMCFNLGMTRLAKFKKMLAALNSRNFVTAATEARDSKWYNQIQRSRSERICAAIERGIGTDDTQKNQQEGVIV